MNTNARIALIRGILLAAAFVVWTWLVTAVDVQPIGPGGSAVGFAGLNRRFHALTGVHMALYTVTDWLGLVPLFVCMAFGTLGLLQWIGRRRLLKVDRDLILLGIHYIVVMAGYLFFEAVPINYRPILIGGIAEASYPSSTTLLVLGVMPTLVFQVSRRSQSTFLVKTVRTVVSVFSAFMVTGRLICGVHWLTDIAGAILLSLSAFHLYIAAVNYGCQGGLNRGIS